MWDLVRNGTLWATRPARVVASARRKDVREYEPAPILAVEIADNIDLKSQPWIESALAFSSSTVSISIRPKNSKTQHMSLRDYLESHFEECPSAYLYIGKTPSQEEIAALKLLQIPYRVVTNLQPPLETEIELGENQARARWHKALDRRYVVYVHFERVEPVVEVLEAFRAARRNYPDLILLVSGIRDQDIPYQPYGYLCLKETPTLKNIEYADILVLQSRVYQPVISSVAMVQIITQMRNLRQIALDAMKRAAAVVFYDVRTQSLGPLTELTSAGTVWSVRKRESLGAAVSQALSLEDSANTIMQSMNRITQNENELLHAIDELLSWERAA